LPSWGSTLFHKIFFPSSRITLTLDAPILIPRQYIRNTKVSDNKNNVYDIMLNITFEINRQISDAVS
jgi:hypothetical protein